MLLAAGRKARPGSRRTIPQTQTSGAAPALKPVPHHEGSCRQDSLSLQSGSYCPTASLESLPVLRFRFLVLLFTSPIGNKAKAPTAPPVQLKICSHA